MRAGFESVVTLLLMGILLDPVFQWVILGASYPGAALVVGPVLIMAPCAAGRALSSCFAKVSGASDGGSEKSGPEDKK